MTTPVPPLHGGWIKLHRCIQNNPLWQERPFDRARAWVDLIVIANHKEGFIRVRGNKIAVMRGQVGYSILSLAERWGWSRGKVERFLNELEKDAQQIKQQKRRVTTLITILNYGKYQSGDTTERATDDTTDDTTDGQQAIKFPCVISDLRPPKNVKNIKNIKPLRAKNPPADSRLFSDWFIYSFRKIEDDQYIFENGKDGKLLTSMLKTVPLKELVAKACHYFTDPDRFPKGRPTLSGLKTSINKYPGHINGKTEYFRELGIIPHDGTLLEAWQPWKD